MGRHSTACVFMATITAIRLQKRRPDRIIIDLDGEFAFSLAATSTLPALRVGAHLDPEQIAALQSRDADEAAYQRCLRLLSFPRTAQNPSSAPTCASTRSLTDVVGRTLERLRQHRHADDAKFCPASGWSIALRSAAAGSPGIGLRNCARRELRRTSRGIGPFRT